MPDRWVQDRRNDAWSRQAKAGGYRARSAFKLKQIQERYELLREGDSVLDVGCHPGGWAQVAVELVGETGLVVGIDLLPCQEVKGATLLVGDITDLRTQETVLEQMPSQLLNAVISDISPDITGKWDIDQTISLSLVAEVFDFGLPLLKSGGNMVAKLFQGVGVEEFIKCVKPHFTKVKRFSPMSSRNSSSEVYLVCRNHVPWDAPKTGVRQRFGDMMDSRLGESDVLDSEAITTKFKVIKRKDP